MRHPPTDRPFPVAPHRTRPTATFLQAVAVPKGMTKTMYQHLLTAIDLTANENHILASSMRQGISPN